MRLGFAEVEVAGPDDPVACRDGRRAYLWQPLSKESGVGPADDAVRIESTHPGPAPRRPINPEERRDHEHGTRPRAGPRRPAPPPARSTGPAEAAKDTGGGGLAALIQEAEAIHEALADAKARRRLIGALRRHRKQARLTSATLAAIRQLRLQEVAE